MEPTLRAFEPYGRVVFVASPSDHAEHLAISRANAEAIIRDGNYAEKIREGIDDTNEPLIFTGADDLLPHPGWFEAAKAKLLTVAERRGPLDHLCQVVGTNDLIGRHREHATHFLIRRDYALEPTIDGGPGPFHQGYGAWYCDDELIATAKKHGVYIYAEDAIVEHLHPMVGKADDDDTYRLARGQARADHQLFRERAHLWAST